MKGKVVLVPFPFDDLSTTKVRPAVCLTDEIKPHGHVILAFITSNVASNPSTTDLVVDASDSDFAQTGLKVSSTIRVHRLMTVSKVIFRRELGELSVGQQEHLRRRIVELFGL